MTLTRPKSYRECLNHRCEWRRVARVLAFLLALATQAVVAEEINLREHFGRFNPEEETLTDKHVFLPTVVISAKLSVCEFDVADIRESGEIPYDRAKLTPAPFLVYRIPLPPHLQRRPEASIKDAIIYWSHEVHTRMDILIVHSSEFQFPERHPRAGDAGYEFRRRRAQVD